MRRYLTWAAVVVLGLVLAFGFLTCGSGQQTAEAATTRVEGTPSGPTTIDTQASDLGAATLAGTSYPHCWVWSPAWSVHENAWPHPVMYAWTIDVEWCSNRAESAVKAFVYHDARDGGGYYVFDWARKHRGAFGYPSVHVFDEWRFHLTVAPFLSDVRHPQVVFDLFANGGITGTVYYDA